MNKLLVNMLMKVIPGNGSSKIYSVNAGRARYLK